MIKKNDEKTNTIQIEVDCPILDIGINVETWNLAEKLIDARRT